LKLFTVMFLFISTGMAMDLPKIGDIVYYTSVQAKDADGVSAVQAAIVTRVRPDGKAALHIFYPSGTYVKDQVPFSDISKPGHWNLPIK
jgi:hypothetical protein